jgi:hypothetical protein
LLAKAIERRRRMRVTTLFKRLLRLEGVRVVAVELEVVADACTGPGADA